MASAMGIQTALLLVLLTVAYKTSRTSAASIPDPSFTTGVIKGRLVAIDKETRTHHSLHRRDVTSVLSGDTHRVGLQLDDGSPPLEMELYRGSVWGPESVLDARWGRYRIRFDLSNEGEGLCHAYGHVTSHEGAVSLDLCGRFTGHIHTPGHHLKIKETPQPSETSGGQASTQTEVKVTKTKVKDAEDILVDGVDNMAEKLVQKAAKDLRKGNNSTGSGNYGIPEVTIEVALFADANYMNHLYQLGYDTTKKAHGWFLHKWNTIQGVYSDVKRIGFKAKFRLVKMELWWYDPEIYVPSHVNEKSRLEWFCSQTPEGDGADQKVLYTFNTGSPKRGSWSKVGKTCVRHLNCYLVKSDTLDVATELHEMGHSFGLIHDDQMEGCRPPYGFMGPNRNYLYKDCYRVKMMERLRNFDCLYRKDFVKDAVPAAPFWMAFS